MKKYLLILFSFLALTACRQADNKQSLQGEWRFALDRNDRGLTEQWYTRSLTDTIHLPGSLQEQGYGDEVGIETPWTGQIVDKSWYDSPLYEKFRQPGNIKVPFWLNPDRHYVGVAWYQKEIDIPASWTGNPVQLELERTHWETTLFLDGVEMGKHESLSTPYRYTFKELTPGKHTLTLRVDNRVNIEVGVNAHSVSDHTQSNWNGVIGTISLTAKPSLYIDDIQIYPNIADKTIKVAVSLDGTTTTNDATLLLQVEKKDGGVIGKPHKVTVDPETGMTQEITLSMGEDALLWSEHSPNLYTLRAVVESNGKLEEQYRTFGLREFKANGTRFEVNGHPVFLRGTLECCIFPLTGYPATDRAYWTKIYNQCKAYGLNHVRFHSWCPPEAAFAVADSMGFYLQVECAGWATVGDGGYSDQWFREESDRILKEYGNHPSFCLMAYGNEPGGANQVKYLSELIDHWKSKDLRRAYTSAGGWPYVENADYWNAPDPRIQGWGEGLRSIINAQPPRTDYDFAHIIRENMPTVSHEIGQWCVYPNLKEMDKYTGVLKAKNFEIFRETLKDHHMADLADAFLYASGRLQTLCYKADIEAALRTPGFAGFQLLDLHDFPGQGTALVGVLDPFWDEKGYVTGEEYSTFCNNTVPLIRFPKMVWLNNETLNVPVEIAHFGEKPLQAAHINWQISDRAGTKLAQGSFTKDLPVTNCIPAGKIEYALSGIGEPSQLIVSVEVKETNSKNQWNIWVYPAKQEAVEQLPYITSTLDNQTMARLDKGENVLLLLAPGSILPEKGGDIRVGFSSIFWNTAWTNKQPPHTLGILCDPAHPALAAFPTEGYSDYQWWDLVSNCNAMVLDDFPADYRPVVQLVDDWFTNRKLGILLEGKIGNGKLMVCSADLQKDLDKRPAARQLRQSILQYMASSRFNPSTSLDPALVKALYQK
ncbi:sugar-binding domain-containing protein [Parabacteroides faecis]|uniref:beta-galactosidase n=1 Tax=Parabacteroides faecis TaxID=1217282 RepID=A0ABR6KP23_9BACT|nr:sugar-binding domain-containing protein [Parabacteroides faecis]MBB4622588.1 putative house-cleaning noncanonical NTP pyrophosphatase (MazG superfamily) [Parabacteroides faecis]GGK09484.1 beta-galactosidase [Parabacteroides faecis]